MFRCFPPIAVARSALLIDGTEMDDAQQRELCPSLPPHIHRPGAPQVGVWVRMNLGWTGYAYGSDILTGKPVKMVVDAPGDVAALCRFMLYRTNNTLAETDLRVLIGGRPVEGDFPVGNYGADKDTAIDMGLAAELAPEQACQNRSGSHNRRVESPARRKFIVRIPEMLRHPLPGHPGETFEGITADGKRVRGRVPVGGAPDGKAIAFLTWGSWADGVVEHTGSMLRKLRTRTREGYCSVGHEVKLELI